MSLPTLVKIPPSLEPFEKDKAKMASAKQIGDTFAPWHVITKSNTVYHQSFGSLHSSIASKSAAIYQSESHTQMRKQHHTFVVCNSTCKIQNQDRRQFIPFQNNKSNYSR